MTQGIPMEEITLVNEQLEPDFERKNLTWVLTIFESGFESIRKTS
jgi:hypothetical protein